MKQKLDMMSASEDSRDAENMEIFEILNEAVVKVLKNGMWDLATCANGELNVVPVAFKDVTEDGKLVVGDVFLETTLKTSRRMLERSRSLFMTRRAWKVIR